MSTDIVEREFVICGSDTETVGADLAIGAGYAVVFTAVYAVAGAVYTGNTIDNVGCATGISTLTQVKLLYYNT